jgi:serine phosphatase RsbU (regulator of sigma subunit)/predicted enzyme related to lactoylglutathione lyase
MHFEPEFPQPLDLLPWNASKARLIGLIIRRMVDAQLKSALDDQLTRYRLSQAAECGGAESRPYLRVNSVVVYVRDQDRSLQFYRDQLGFHVVLDVQIDADIRWVAVTPSEGSAVLGLVKAPKDSERGYVGRPTGVSLITEDIAAKFQEWSERGVRFLQPPTTMPWGLHSRFEDIDGNQFELMQSPWLVEILNAERRAAEARKEAEQRAVYELEIAKQVQARLFPQRLPPLETLEYRGTCLQAYQVGGDYYDFLDLGPGHLALVVGDVAGKGIAGALLMANLQASLRSRLRQALEGLPQLLRSVNRLLYENTADNTYATLFFAEYQDKTQRLRYVNCGHHPALLQRRDQALERLESTSMVLGAFAQWECRVAEVRLARGDTLLLYTDGITEALDHDGREFGEDKLLNVLRTHRHLPVPQLLDTILEGVREFSDRDPVDDMTLVIARSHPVGKS